MLWMDKRPHKNSHKGHCLIWGWNILVALGVSGYVCETLRLGAWVWLPASSCPQLLLATCSPCLHPPPGFFSMWKLPPACCVFSSAIPEWVQLCVGRTGILCSPHPEVWALWQGQLCSSQDWGRVAQLRVSSGELTCSVRWDLLFQY